MKTFSYAVRLPIISNTVLILKPVNCSILDNQFRVRDSHGLQVSDILIHFCLTEIDWGGKPRLEGSKSIGWGWSMLGVYISLLASLTLVPFLKSTPLHARWRQCKLPRAYTAFLNIKLQCTKQITVQFLPCPRVHSRSVQIIRKNVTEIYFLATSVLFSFLSFPLKAEDYLNNI
jgi:hypothetical protein